MRMDESSKANPRSFESTTVPFFTILLICFICIFFLLVFFIYKCFQDKKDEVTEKIPCIDANGGDDCSSSPANETNEAGDQEKILMQIIGSNAPVRPGILVQRQNKVVTSLGNREGTEAEKEVKMKDRQGPEDSGEVNQEDENLQETLIPSVTESQKRPLKGVTFSREVIIVNLGNEQHPAHQRYAQEHKERRKSPKRHKRKGNINTE